MDHYRINHFSFDSRATRRRIRIALAAALLMSTALVLAASIIAPIVVSAA